jgi:hypothetical protein
VLSPSAAEKEKALETQGLFALLGGDGGIQTLSNTSGYKLLTWHWQIYW